MTVVGCPWKMSSKCEVVYILSEANLVDVPSRQRGFDMWSLQQSTQQELLYLVESTLDSHVFTDPFAGREHSSSKINASVLSSQ